MKSIYELILVVLIFVPLLFYLGYKIYKGEEINRYLVYFSFILGGIILLHHIISLIKGYKSYKSGVKFNKNLGVFLALLGCFILSFNGYIIYLKLVKGERGE